ncbi:MAG: zinc-ribbon domain-containing protein [Chlamydiae bacterium]|nr:zinc-ribbon domain-containing protein [Chlamydiota bacterium]
MLAGSIGIDLSSKPSPSQSDREFEEPLEWNGYDQGNFLPNAQGGPSPQPNHRSRPRKRKKFVRDHVADLQWHVSKNEELKDQTCGSRKMVWWLCEQGHEWQASIVSRCKAEKAPACPVCRPKRAAETSLEGQPPRKKKRR